jgi:hypothetical protein
VARDHSRLTPIGRTMLANTMIVSRFRYWWQSMAPPDFIVDALCSDVEALVWAKDVSFEADEIGTNVKFRRFLKKGAQFSDRRTELGIGMLDIPSHIKALQLNWLLKYRGTARAATGNSYSTRGSRATLIQGEEPRLQPFLSKSSQPAPRTVRVISRSFGSNDLGPLRSFATHARVAMVSRVGPKTPFDVTISTSETCRRPP